MTRAGTLGLGLGVFGLAALLVAPEPARATLEMQKQAKALGQPAKNCLYCHGEKLPKKGAVTNNHRGQWLVAEKERRKAKHVDVAWLEHYVEEKETKE